MSNMIITTGQTKAGRISIFADGEFKFSVSPDYWYSLGICEEDDISEERIEQIAADVEIAKCCNSAYAYLSRRAHSVKELRTKLLRKYNEDAVDIAIEKASELRLLDDADYAVNFADELLRLRHYGPARIKAELLKRGISREDIEAAVQSLEYSAETEIEQLLMTKYKNSLNDEKNVKKTIASLMRMGYNYGDIRSALNIYLSDEVYYEET